MGDLSRPSRPQTRGEPHDISMWVCESRPSSYTDRSAYTVGPLLKEPLVSPARRSQRQRRKGQWWSDKGRKSKNRLPWALEPINPINPTQEDGPDKGQPLTAARQHGRRFTHGPPVERGVLESPASELIPEIVSICANTQSPPQLGIASRLHLHKLGST